MNVPSYEGYNEYVLKAAINGRMITGREDKTYTETQNIQLLVEEVSKSHSLSLLKEAETAIELMKSSGFNIQEVENLLKEAKSQMDIQKNKEALDIANQIISIKDKALQISEMISKVREALKNPRKTNLLTGKAVGETNGFSLSKIFSPSFSSKNTEETLRMAEAAFARGDYSTAEERAKSAQMLLLLERKGDIGLFVYLYWPFITLGIAILLSLGVFFYKIHQRSGIKDRIKDTDDEEVSIKNLIQTAQKDYFSGKMSSSDYHRKIGQYSHRLADVKEKRLNSEEQEDKGIRVKRRNERS